MSENNLGCVVRAHVTAKGPYVVDMYFPGKPLTADEAEKKLTSNYHGYSSARIEYIKPVIYASNKLKHIKATISASMTGGTANARRGRVFIPSTYFSGIIVDLGGTYRLWRTPLTKAQPLGGASHYVVPHPVDRLDSMRVDYHWQCHDHHYLNLEGYVDFKKLQETEYEYVKRSLNRVVRDYYDGVRRQIDLALSSEDWNK
jgi:hypothetical protein